MGQLLQTTALAAALALGLVACGGKAVVDTATDSCPMPEALGSQECHASPDLFVLEGTGSDGVNYREECDGTTCTWFADGPAVCDCRQLDWANVGPNGIPLCAEWTPPWDFSTLTCDVEP